MENVIGIASIFAAFGLLYVIYLVRQKWVEQREKKLSQKHKSVLAAACLCPSCKMNVVSAINAKIEGRRNKIYDDLQMACPYCEAEVLWDVMGTPPVPKRVIPKKREEKSDEEASRGKGRAV